jgi:CBS domain containing-hemolysin-like protein
MIGVAILLGLIGVLLSGFFSGAETGFYRAARMRLVLDALDGDLIARGLVKLTNHPALFIATSLVGTNLANYLVSFATVLAIEDSSQGAGRLGELIASLWLTPLVFVYGELLPKNFFLHAPNRLLRKCGPLFLLFVVLFFPISVVLWGLNRLLSKLVAKTPEQVRLAIARRELRRVLEEGHEEGILYPAQQELAQGIFAVAKNPVTGFLTPLAEVPRARAGSSKADVLRLAQRMNVAAVPIEESGRLLGYVRVVDLKLDRSDGLGPLRPLLVIPHTDAHIDALMRMHAAKESLAQVVDAQGRVLGMLLTARIGQPLFGGGA